MTEVYAAHRRQNQMMEDRLNIVSKLYRRGYSLNETRREVMRQLGLKTYSLSTVRKDRDRLLKEWREERIKDTDALLDLELERIDEAVRELWEQWERSKADSTSTERRAEGTPDLAPARDANGKLIYNPDGSVLMVPGKMKTRRQSQTSREAARLGDPAYLREIRKWLERRDRLLGLNAPEKVDISGDMSFSALLMESGMLDEAEDVAGLNAATERQGGLS
ncbi:MAG: hypothetical protein LUC24_00810 [Bacteroidales bacterium]|nr:hypothetical protein [Bacteroidales bacterium]